MEHDIYKAPQAELVSNLPDTPEFYVVSERKFLILAIATVGTYLIYWFYRHWKNQKLKHSDSIWPVARAIFNIFFTHALFKRIQGKLTEVGKTFTWSPRVMATVFVIASIISNISDRIYAQEGAPVIFSLIGFATLIPMVWSSYKAQQAANIACDDVAGKQNSKITAVNMAWIIFGVIIWMLLLFDLYTEMVGLPASL